MGPPGKSPSAGAHASVRPRAYNRVGGRPVALDSGGVLLAACLIFLLSLLRLFRGRRNGGVAVLVVGIVGDWLIFVGSF